MELSGGTSIKWVLFSYRVQPLNAMCCLQRCAKKVFDNVPKVQEAHVLSKRVFRKVSQKFEYLTTV
jgi:hypothetical protein